VLRITKRIIAGRRDKVSQRQQGEFSQSF